MTGPESKLWSPDFELGIPIIDGQHRNLVHHLELLLEGITKAKGDDVLPCLGFLQKYTVEHFATEERFMRQHGFTGLDAHAAQHSEFRQTVLKARKFIRRNPTGEKSAQLVQSMLIRWYVKHVKGSDQQYAAFFREKNVVDQLR